MSKSITLSHQHYAAKWKLPTDGEFNDLSVVNQAGIDYALLPDGPAKEDKLLEIVRYFHGYVYKYADLIVRGHVPHHIYNGDTRRFLKYFLPKSDVPDKAAFDKVTKHLHLAFPQQSSADVYDILNLLLLRCVKKYDPTYVDKVKDIVKIIQRLRKSKFIPLTQIGKKVKFDPTGSVRLLARKEYIKAVRGAGKKLMGYKVTKLWPPSKEFLSSGPIGFVYFVQTWFRYYLQEYIDDQMKTLEARAWDKMIQLEHRTSQGEDMEFTGDIPNVDGELTDGSGHAWSADMSMITKCLDLSAITPAWVQGNSDPLFKNMTLTERQLIYLFYVAEDPWKQISNTMGMSITQVQKIHNEILTFLRGKFKVS
jgi:hypothetical protein